MNPVYQGLIDDFISRCRRTFGSHLQAAALYGSVARGSAQPTSDIDFILVFDDLPKVRSKRIDMIFPLVQAAENSPAAQELRNKGFYPFISPLLYTIEEIERTQPILLDITEDGIILFDNGILKNKLQRLRERLKELGAKRIVEEDGSMYWDLKPDWRPGEVIEL
ncbi:MAG: nucleotidyltransferase domain-containing protein [candidate division KSB1 bacterium]|nr:nucleotidyltransferase domain-containing protein [candidate division KSB1 bacterium]MDZ7304174.1 nucleotidyltransferase domain-containing protein [candidate division KSB1 bacterium]MDZ7310646.1 nucleotidyltransferase domain-containing protein [candidate division KSB1 bacterium]